MSKMKDLNEYFESLTEGERNALMQKFNDNLVEKLYDELERLQEKYDYSASEWAREQDEYESSIARLKGIINYMTERM